MKVTITEIAKAVQAKNDWQAFGEILCTGVEFDSRKIKQGDLFIPLKGTRDGHMFFQTAAVNGAVLTLWAEDYHPYPKEFPYLLVPDTLEAMQAIAQYVLEKERPKVIGITGSNGKTTTKDMVAAVLGQKYSTYKTQGNYNNEIGLPYTILQMPAGTEMLVLEMGMDRLGDIEKLTKLAKPDIAAITLIGESHIEFFGSRAGIAQGKMEIVAGLAAEGCLLVPANEPLLVPLLKKVEQAVQTFGLLPTADISGQVLEETANSLSFTCNLYPRAVFRLPFLGQYNVNNALIAIAIGQHFSVSEADIQRGLQTMQLTKNRTEWKTAANGAKLLSDVYNANPTAMSLVLDSFSQLSQTVGRRAVVLGDMGELGVESAHFHQALASHVSPTSIDDVFLYGEKMAALYTTLQTTFPSERLHYFSTTERPQLVERLKQYMEPADMLLFKASNSMNLAGIVEELL